MNGSLVPAKENSERLIAAETERDGLRRRIDSLCEEKNKLRKRIAQQAVEATEEQASRLKASVADQERGFVHALERAKIELADVKEEFRREKGRLEAMVDSLSTTLKEKEAERRKVNDQALASARLAVEMEVEVEVEAHCTAANVEAQDRIRKFEMKVLRLEDNQSRSEADHATEASRLKHACEACRMDADLAGREREAMSKTVLVAQDKSEQLKKDLKNAKKSLREVKKGWDVAIAELEQSEEKSADMEAHNEILESKLKGVLQDLGRAKQESASQKQASTSLVDEMKKRLGKESKAIKKNREQEVRCLSRRHISLACLLICSILHGESFIIHLSYAKQIEKLKTDLSKERRKSSAYKEKALEAHQKNLRAKEAIACLTMNTNIGDNV